MKSWKPFEVLFQDDDEEEEDEDGQRGHQGGDTHERRPGERGR